MDASVGEIFLASDGNWKTFQSRPDRSVVSMSIRLHRLLYVKNPKSMCTVK